MKSKMILIIIVALLSIGTTYYVIKPSVNAKATTKEQTIEEKMSKGIEIPGLKIEPAVAGEGWDMVVVSGKVSVPSDKLVRVSSRIDGKVVAAYGKPGDSVRQGQKLAVISSIDLAEARSGYRQALARLIAAQMNLEQELEIARLGVHSIRPVEEAKSNALETQGNLSDAKSELAQAKSELSKAESELAQCKARLERAKELYSDKIVSRQDMETADAEFKRDNASVDSAKSKVNQAESRIEKAKSAADIAKQYQAREERVYKGRVLDARAVQSAKAEVASAKIGVQAAVDKIRVLGANPNGSGETIAVTSPISGRIVSRNINVGETTSPSNALFTVANLSNVWVEAEVYEKDLAKIRNGQTAEISVSSYPDRVFGGKVDSIGDILSADSRTAKVRCMVANPQGLLKGEMFAQVSFMTAKRGSTVLIPKQAILDDSGKKIVFTPCMECPEDVKAGTNACGAYDKFDIETGSTHGSRIEVLKGIEPGTMVVTVGQHQLKTALGSGQLEAGCKGH